MSLAWTRDLPAIDPWLRGETARLDVDGATDVRVGPRPIQVPRPPIWIGGMRPGALRRAARWDGWIAIGTSDDGSSMALAPEAFGAMVGRVDEERASLGRDRRAVRRRRLRLQRPGRAGLVRSYAAQGATWWLESLSPMRGSVDELLAIVEGGPPGIA